MRYREEIRTAMIELLDEHEDLMVSQMNDLIKSIQRDWQRRWKIYKEIIENITRKWAVISTSSH